MIIPPSHPGGVVPTPALSVEPAAVGAVAGVRAAVGNSERQDRDPAGREAGVVFEPSAQRPPPLPIYGPDGRAVGAAEAEEEQDEAAPIAGEEVEESEETGSTEATRPGAVEELDPADQRMVEQLRARDAEVRAHEAAHVAAGGQHVRGGASFSFQTGPDGRQYAIGGEVGIDVAPVPGDPDATATKARQVRAAALAPANPSGADRSIAARASQMEADAMIEVAQAQREQTAGAREASPWDRYVQEPSEGSVGGRLSLVA